jgi:hypothetical protein
MNYPKVKRVGNTSELQHFGTLGMHWGVRRFQNEDGTLTPAGQRKQKSDIKKKELTDLTEKMHKENSRIAKSEYNEEDRKGIVYDRPGQENIARRAAKYVQKNSSLPYGEALKKATKVEVVKQVSTYMATYALTAASLYLVTKNLFN